MTDPLAGFVLFRNTPEVVQLSIGRGYVRISSDALRMIGDPKHINIFFDEAGKRMAVKAADSKMPNTFSMGKNTGVNKCAMLFDRIIEVSGQEWHPGEVIRFNGMKFNDEYVIFNLSRSKVTKYDNHVAVMNAKRAKKEEGS